MIRPLDESQRSSPLQGRGSWLMCEVALAQRGAKSGKDFEALIVESLIKELKIEP
jgi:hypothetical protein